MGGSCAPYDRVSKLFCQKSNGKTITFQRSQVQRRFQVCLLHYPREFFEKTIGVGISKTYLDVPFKNGVEATDDIKVTELDQTAA